jgi:hypothetical protein
MDEQSGDGAATAGRRYTEWRCTACGHAHPKNHPPCDRCGAMSFEMAEVEATDFDAELRGPSYPELLRENWLLAAVAGAVVLVAGVAVLTSTGVFVLSDPLGLGYRYGAVEAVEPNDDGRFTAGELHARLEADHDVEAVRWSGRELRVVYTTEAGSQTELRDEVVAIGRAYGEYARAGGGGDRLRVVATAEGRTVARVPVDRELAVDLAAGRVEEGAFRTTVFG